MFLVYQCFTFRVKKKGNVLRIDWKHVKQYIKSQSFGHKFNNFFQIKND